jgi:hypothetical protein
MKFFKCFNGSAFFANERILAALGVGWVDYVRKCRGSIRTDARPIGLNAITLALLVLSLILTFPPVGDLF